MPVRASCVLVSNGISVALLSTGAYLQEGVALFFSLYVFCSGKLDCVWNVGEQVQTGVPCCGPDKSARTRCVRSY